MDRVTNKNPVSDLVDAVYSQDADTALNLLDEALRTGGPCGVRDLAKAASRLGASVTFGIEANATHETIFLSRVRYGYSSAKVAALTVGRCQR